MSAEMFSFPPWIFLLFMAVGVLLIVVAYAYNRGRDAAEREHRMADLERRVKELEGRK